MPIRPWESDQPIIRNATKTRGWVGVYALKISIFGGSLDNMGNLFAQTTEQAPITAMFGSICRPFFPHKM